MKKVILVVVVLILVFGIAFYFAKKNTDNYKIGVTNTVQKVNESKTNVVTTNNNIANEIINNTVNEIQQDETEKQVENTETFETNPKTEVEKAIDIVKKDWKGSQDVSFVENGIEDGGFIINVCDSKTMDVYAFYIVNVKTETFMKKEMN